MDDMFDYLKESWNNMNKKPLAEEGDAGGDAGDAGGEFNTSGNFAKFKSRLGSKYAGRLRKRKVSEAEGAEALDSAKEELAKAIKNKASNIQDTPVLEDENELMDEPVDELSDIEDGDFDEVEEPQDVINQILAKYPNAVITICVELPEDETFDAETIAAAQEVAEIPEEEGTQDTQEVADEEKIEESRKQLIKKNRKLIREMYNVIEDDDLVADEVTDLEDEVADDAISDEEVTDIAPEPKVEITDTSISLAPEQWEQVVTTVDILDTEVSSDEEGLDAEEGTDELEEIPDEVE